MANLINIYKGMPDANKAIQKNFEAVDVNDTGWINLEANSEVTNRLFRYRKIGDFVDLEFEFIPNSVMGSTKVLATLPDEAKPASDCRFTTGSNSLNRIVLMSIPKNGEISCWAVYGLTNGAVPTVTTTAAFAAPIYMKTRYSTI